MNAGYDIHIAISLSVCLSVCSFVRVRLSVRHTLKLHCVQKKTPTHIFFHISMNDVWI